MDIVTDPLTLHAPLLLIAVSAIFLVISRGLDGDSGPLRQCAAALALLAGGDAVTAVSILMYQENQNVIAAVLSGVSAGLMTSGAVLFVMGSLSNPLKVLRLLRVQVSASMTSFLLLMLTAALISGVAALFLPVAMVAYAAASVGASAAYGVYQHLLKHDRTGAAIYVDAGGAAPFLLLLWSVGRAVMAVLVPPTEPLGAAAAAAMSLLLPVALLPVLYRQLILWRDAATLRFAQAEEQGQEELRRARRFQHLLETLPEAFLVVGPTGVIVDANRQAMALLGGRQVRAGGLCGVHVSEFLREESGAAADWAALLSEEAVSCDFSVAGAHDSGHLPVRAVMTRTDYDGHPLCLMVLHDLSEERRSGAMNAFLHELDRTAIAGGNPEEIQQQLCHQICDLFGLAVTVIVVPDRQGGLGVRGVAGAAPEAIAQLLSKPEWNNGVLQDVMRMGGRLLLAGHDSELPASLPVPQDWLVILPLWGQTEVIGCLMVAGTGLAPDQRSLKQMDTVSARLGNALQVMQDQTQMRLQGTALAAAANAIFITDVQGRIEWVNAAFTRLSGYEAHEVLGKTPALLRSGMQDDDSYRRFWDTIKGGRVWRGEMVERRKDGSLYTVDQTVAPILDERDQIAHFVTVHEDITERKRAEERIAYLSNYDTLTRLPNRVLFRDHLYQAVNQARNNRGSLAVLFVDLDRFSRVNDTLGHDIGDQLLMTIASRINAVAAPEADTIARIGGDEFALIQSRLPNTEAAASLARKVIDAVNRPVDIGGLEVRVGTNVGIAIYPQDGEDPDHLIKNADMAMYRAVRSESEKCFFYSNEMNDEARARLALEGDLRRALDNGDLRLHFQPQVDVRSRRIIGVEALLRWQHADHGMIPPSRFIPVAEDSGLILPIGDWVIEEAIRQSRVWQDAGLPLITVAINISAVQFQQGTLVRRVGDAISRSGVDPSRIELELTESMLMQDAREAIRTLEDLSGLGAKLAIDDFGTGYSSLSYLKQFPVDRLKLDQSFVRQMTTNHSDAVIARATINLGHSLGLEVIAEGVETEDQYEYLRAEGCDVVQGYLFGKPMAPDDLAAVLRYSGPGGSVAAGRLPEGVGVPAL